MKTSKPLKPSFFRHRYNGISTLNRRYGVETQMRNTRGTVTSLGLKVNGLHHISASLSFSYTGRVHTFSINHTVLIKYKKCLSFPINQHKQQIIQEDKCVQWKMECNGTKVINFNPFSAGGSEESNAFKISLEKCELFSQLI